MFGGENADRQTIAADNDHVVNERNITKILKAAIAVQL